MSSLSDKLASKKFAHRDVMICLDGELTSRRDAALGAVVAAAKAVRASSRTDGDAPTGAIADDRLGSSAALRARTELAAAEQAVAEVEDAMRAVSITIRFTALPFPKYNAILLKNPPRSGRQEPFNPQTFFIAVAKASGEYVDDDGQVHGISPSEWAEIEQSLTDGEHDRIAGALIDLNRTEGLQGVDFLSRDSEKTTDSSETSASPAPSE